MSEPYLIPDAWALSVAALGIGVSVEEAQAMIDAGELELTIESVERMALRKDLERLKVWDERLKSSTVEVGPRKRSRARRS